MPRKARAKRSEVPRKNATADQDNQVGNEHAQPRGQRHDQPPRIATEVVERFNFAIGRSVTRGDLARQERRPSDKGSLSPAAWRVTLRFCNHGYIGGACGMSAMEPVVSAQVRSDEPAPSP